MSPASAEAIAVLSRVARAHVGASSGEQAAWEILRNLRRGEPVNFGNAFVRLDASAKGAVIQILADLAVGKTGLVELG